MSELHCVVHTDRGGPRAGRRGRSSPPGQRRSTRCCSCPSRTARRCCLVVFCFGMNHCRPPRQVGQMSDELQALSVQGAEIIQALHARDGSRSHAHDEKASKAEKSGSQRAERHFFEHSEHSETLQDLPYRPSENSCAPEACVRAAPPCPLGCNPTAVPRAKAFFRRASAKACERDVQTWITVQVGADLVVSDTPLGAAGPRFAIAGSSIGSLFCGCHDASPAR